MPPVAPVLPPSKPASPSPSTRLPFKCLTIEEMVVPRNQGLCYHCDDKWRPGHHCKPHLHLIIADEDVVVPVDSTPSDSPSPFAVDLFSTPYISLNAMEGTSTPKTFRLLGLLRNHQVVILVDGGSMHNLSNRVWPSFWPYLHRRQHHFESWSTMEIPWTTILHLSRFLS